MQIEWNWKRRANPEDTIILLGGLILNTPLFHGPKNFGGFAEKTIRRFFLKPLFRLFPRLVNDPAKSNTGHPNLPFNNIFILLFLQRKDAPLCSKETLARLLLSLLRQELVTLSQRKP